MKVSVIGVQGSGKGTQADLISKKLSVPHISTGDMLRAHVSTGSTLGKKAAEFMNAGNLVPDDLIIAMLGERLKQPDAAKGFVLDGFPRNIEQAQALQKITHLDRVFEIAVSDREAVRRISGRRSCSCGAVYHIFFKPTARPGICDRCGKAIFQRDDDKEEAVAKRVQLYHEKTEPVLMFYKKLGILHSVNGEQSIESVFGEIGQKI